MIKTNQEKIAKRMRWLFAARAVKCFARRQDGTAALEFALVATPFLALTFAIIESAFVFFAGQTLAVATTDTGRLIMTGQAQTQGFDAATFKTALCSKIYGLFDCVNGIYVDVKAYSNFASISTSSPIKNGKIDPTKVAYSPGGPGNIVVVTTYYQWPIYVTMPLANLGTTRLLAATSVMRVEPYN